MTNQPDAYALAAQAAADRARAEALQKGTAPAPGLQNPMRRLSKNPATRWLLSAVLLAAATALAVDYLNTPLRAWLQYHAPVPGAGGKSVAEIAAEQSAAPQAKIDQEITAPANAAARGAALKQEGDALKASLIHEGDPIQLMAPARYYRIESPVAADFPTSVESLNYIQERYDGDVIARPPSRLNPGEQIAPARVANGDAAMFGRYVLVRRGPDDTGLMPLADFQQAISHRNNRAPTSAAQVREAPPPLPQRSPGPTEAEVRALDSFNTPPPAPAGGQSPQ